jgi:hypothetical protein
VEQTRDSGLESRKINDHLVDNTTNEFIALLIVRFLYVNSFCYMSFSFQYPLFNIFNRTKRPHSPKNLKRYKPSTTILINPKTLPDSFQDDRLETLGRELMDSHQQNALLKGKLDEALRRCEEMERMLAEVCSVIFFFFPHLKPLLHIVFSFDIFLSFISTYHTYINTNQLTHSEPGPSPRRPRLFTKHPHLTNQKTNTARRHRKTLPRL